MTGGGVIDGSATAVPECVAGGATSYAMTGLPIDQVIDRALIARSIDRAIQRSIR
jgi:hypothetical protein